MIFFLLDLFFLSGVGVGVGVGGSQYTMDASMKFVCTLIVSCIETPVYDVKSAKSNKSQRTICGSEELWLANICMWFAIYFVLMRVRE